MSTQSSILMNIIGNTTNIDAAIARTRSLMESLNVKNLNYSLGQTKRLMADLPTTPKLVTAVQMPGREGFSEMQKQSAISSALEDSMSRRNNFASVMAPIQKKIRVEMQASARASWNMEKGMKNVTAKLQAASAASRTFTRHMLGAGLSMLFTGMALKRFADGALRGMLTVYKDATDNTDSFTNTTNRLSAAWTFFKFSFIDALANDDAILGMLDNVITFVDWLSSLSPETKEWLVILLFVLAVIGGIMMVVGQTALFFIGLVAISMILGVSVGVIVLVLAIIIIVILAVIAIWKIWNGSGSKTQKIIKTIIVVLLVILVIIALVAGGWVLLLVAAILIVIAFVWKFRDKIVDAMKSAVDWIKDKWEKFINWLIDGLNAIIRLVNKIPGVNIGQIGHIGGVDEYQEGGFVPRTGPAILHAGEFVLSKKMLASGSGEGVNVGGISVAVYSDTSDPDRLADMVGEKIIAEFERYAHRGGI
jgi:hypothetical protein